MAESLLDRECVRALGDQERGAGMSQVMGYRVDIVVRPTPAESRQITIAEVRYMDPRRAESIAQTVNIERIIRYGDRLQRDGVATARDDRLSAIEWAVHYEDPRGTRWYAWAAIAGEDGLDYGNQNVQGHIYFTRQDLAPRPIKDRARPGDDHWHPIPDLGVSCTPKPITDPEPGFDCKLVEVPS